MRQRRADDTTTFLDFLFLMVLVILLLVNDPVPPTKADAPPPGNLIVSIVWPAGDTDVDLWVMSKGEGRPVGYSNRTGAVWSLLRDDLGNKNDLTELNFENAYSRTVDAGQWLALSLTLGAVAYFSAWSRYPTKARGLTVAAFALSLPISGALILHARGWSAPVVPYLVTIPEGELDVLGAKMVPEVAIYIWLDVGGSPRAFELPWDAKTASQLQRALEGGNGVKAKRPKGTADDEEYPMIFYPNPQPAAPEKQPEAPGPVYQFPEG